MKIIFITSFLTIIFSVNNENKLLGRWESKSETGAVTGVVFKADSTFEGYVNKKPFVTGRYSIKDDVFSFVDNGCNGYKGVYKLQFRSNNDSLRFEAISDSCEQRKNGMQRLNMGRVNR